MWNNRPDEELPRSFTPHQGTAGVPTRPTPSSMEVKKETTTTITPPTITPPTAKADFAPARKSSAVIGEAVKIVGEIYSNEDLVIEGFVQGTVEALQQKLTIGPKGTLHARVQVREVDVQGSVQGDVEATERIDIRKDAKLVGDIKAARIVIEDGAYFNGRIEIVRPEPAAKPQLVRPTATPATSPPTSEAPDRMMASAS